jgi:hypothetical protein
MILYYRILPPFSRLLFLYLCIYSSTIFELGMTSVVHVNNIIAVSRAERTASDDKGNYLQRLNHKSHSARMAGCSGHHATLHILLDLLFIYSRRTRTVTRLITLNPFGTSGNYMYHLQKK